MKVIFPKDNEKLICKKCKTEIKPITSYSEDSLEENYWCNFCTDFVDVKIFNAG